MGFVLQIVSVANYFVKLFLNLSYAASLGLDCEYGGTGACQLQHHLHVSIAGQHDCMSIGNQTVLSA